MGKAPLLQVSHPLDFDILSSSFPNRLQGTPPLLVFKKVVWVPCKSSKTGDKKMTQKSCLLSDEGGGKVWREKNEEIK
jgi:hypothetical protein